jgi:hypothetical protein
MTVPPEQEQIEAIGEQLRAKIGSKFTASTFLAGFALAVLTSQVSALWQTNDLPLLFAPAVGAVFGGFVLFVDGIISLDELTMPKRFWREDSTAVGLPVPLGGSYLTNEDLWELQKRMVFFWQHLTIVATFVTATAVMAMLIPWWQLDAEMIRGWTFWCSVLGVTLAFGYIRWLNAQASQKFNHLVRPVD